MTNKNQNEENKKDGKKKRSVFSTIITTLLILAIIAGGVVGAMVLSIIKDAPEIDPSEINASLNQTSSIYDAEGNLIEKIEAAEFRTFVSLDKVPEHLVDAFIAIEDERFYKHSGVDPKGILAAMADNIKSGRIVRGASTITQQLAKNVYLTSEKKLSRKIKEAYLAFQIENALTKDQIMEAYLNLNFFGQNAYGVQEAAQTYFAKNVEDLTIAESAVLAGVVKSTTNFQPYIRVKPEEFNPDTMYDIAETDVLGEKYILVFNEKSIERQKLVLKKMKELDFITEAEYQEALNQDIKTSLQPGEKKIAGITSYFSDFVKTETMRLLQEELGYDEVEAEEALFTGGLKIYTTIDVDLQKELEHVYDNFTEILVGDPSNYTGPILIDWKLDGAGNVLDDKGKIIFYKQENILLDDGNLVIGADYHSFNNSGDLILNTPILTAYPKHIEIADYYRIDERKNLVTHTMGSLSLSEEDFTVADTGEIIIYKSFLDNTEGFYSIDENGRLIIGGRYFYRDQQGAVQPQSASVIIDYRNGHIKSVVGGRELDGTRILNRATSALRQPGSIIKPISVYLPALDNGYTAASGIDDIPMVVDGELWPNNWYLGYKGIQSLRTSVEQSINVNSVRTVNDIGYDTSMEYLAKMGIIDKEHPERDNFVTAAENPKNNDENPSALALGGMTKGLTPLEITAAFGTIANDGVFVEPTPILKILDKDGNTLLDYKPKETQVVSPQIAYIMKDILNTTVTNGIARQAQVPNQATAGKTGTTQHQADLWFVGFTPYYVSGVWIGYDSPVITLNKTSGTAAQLWRNIMTRAHEGLEPTNAFSRPEGIVTQTVCTLSGKLPNGNCNGDPRGVVKSEIFAAGTEPTGTCDVHITANIDTTTGMVANEYCPVDAIQGRAFIKRTTPYRPENHKGIVPDDFQYSLPGVCTIHSAENPGYSGEEPEDLEEENIDEGEQNENQGEEKPIEEVPEDNKDKDDGGFEEIPIEQAP